MYVKWIQCNDLSKTWQPNRMNKTAQKKNGNTTTWETFCWTRRQKRTLIATLFSFGMHSTFYWHLVNQIKCKNWTREKKHRHHQINLKSHFQRGICSRSIGMFWNICRALVVFTIIAKWVAWRGWCTPIERTFCVMIKAYDIHRSPIMTSMHQFSLRHSKYISLQL